MKYRSDLENNSIRQDCRQNDQVRSLDDKLLHHHHNLQGDGPKQYFGV